MYHHLIIVNRLNLRHFDIFFYGWKQYTTTDDNKKRELYKKEKKRETEKAKLFQLLEAFMESSPQLLLQMYILATEVSKAPSNGTGQIGCNGNCTTTNNSIVDSSYSDQLSTLLNQPRNFTIKLSNG